MKSFRVPLWWGFLLPMVVSAATRGFWAPDEPRYAQVAVEAWSSGSLLVMHLCGEVYPDKPPLLFWLAGALARVLGRGEFVMRLPSLVATAGSAAIIAALARRWWGALEARWAPVIYLSCVLVVEIGGRLQIDPLLSFFVLAAVFALPDESTPTRQRARRLWATGLLTGLGALAKGPVALIEVSLVVAAWRLVPGCRPRPTLAGWPGALVLAASPVLAWALAASLAEPALAEHLFFGQHAGRALNASAPHAGPVWKHALRVPQQLLPWTPVVAAGLFASRRVLSGGDPGLARSATWFLVLFTFFSVIPPKRDLYLLPAYPALALAGARAIGQFEARRTVHAVVRRAMTGLFMLAVIALILTSVLHDRFVDSAELIPGVRWRALVLAGPLAAGWIVALRALRRGRVESWFSSLAVGVGLMWLGVATLVFGPLDRAKSPRGLAMDLAARSEQPDTVPCLGVRPEGYRFYGNLPAVYGGLGRALAREGDLLALVEARAFDHLPASERESLVVLETRDVGSRTVLVCGRRPEEARQ